eukprot:gene3105-13117_t
MRNAFLGRRPVERHRNFHCKAALELKPGHRKEALASEARMHSLICVRILYAEEARARALLG